MCKLWGSIMREPEFSNRFEQRAENCEQRAIKSADPLVAEILIELAKDFRSRAKAQEIVNQHQQNFATSL